MELVTSYILEAFTGGWLWNYNSYWLNFQGRIALNPSVRFGIGGIVFIYILQPLFEKVFEKLGEKKASIFSYVLVLVIIVDSIYTFLIK